MNVILAVAEWLNDVQSITTIAGLRVLRAPPTIVLIAQGAAVVGRHGMMMFGLGRAGRSTPSASN